MELVFFLTLVETALGMGVVQCFIPRSALGAGFGKTNSAIIFFCLLAPAIFTRRLLDEAGHRSQTSTQVTGVVALVLWVAYFVVLSFPRDRTAAFLASAATMTTAFMLAAAAAGLSRYYAAQLSSAGHDQTPGTMILSVGAGAFATALVLGTVTMAMLIGHWYLVIPGLAIKWLKGACLAFAGSLGLKAISIGIALAVAVHGHPWGARGFFDEFTEEKLWFLFIPRVVVTLGIGGTLAVMAYRAAAIRATQSSTGILFPAMIVIYLGEMIATFLMIGLAGIAI